MKDLKDSVEDMSLIINEASRVKNYHTAYFNSLKSYNESLEEISDVSIIDYGLDIPEDYCSEVLKALQKEGA